MLSGSVQIDGDWLRVVHAIVPDRAPDFFRARLHAVDVDHVVDPAEVTIVATAEALDLVPMSTQSFPVRTFWDAVVVLFFVIVVQKVRREADRRRDQEDFASTPGLSVIQDHEIEAEGGGREARRGG